MGTHYYGLPTVDPESTLSFPDAVNGLGNSTDAVLHGIQEGFKGEDYDLPVASSDVLGGVRIGKGFKVFSDGLLTTSQDRFKLKPATADALGGVYIGKNVTVDAEGHIGVGAGAFGSIDVGTAQLEDKAVTTEKFADASVNEDKAAPAVVSTLQSPAAIWKNAQVFEILLQAGGSFTCKFKMHRINDNFAFISASAEDGLLYLFREKGTPHDLLKPSNAGKYAPGELGTGTVSVGIGFMRTSTAHYYTDSDINIVKFDLTNATATPAENCNSDTSGIIRAFPGYLMEV